MRRFKALNLQTAQSEDGVVIGFTRFDELQCRYGERLLSLYCEPEFDEEEEIGEGSTQVIDMSDLKWEPPYQDEAISDEQKKEIAQDVANAMECLETRYRIE